MKNTKPIERVGLVANSAKPACRQLVQKAAALISKAGRAVWMDEATAELSHVKAQATPGVASLTREIDLLLVFGGDGTMLRVARDMKGARTPVLGIKMGGLGFLTIVPSSNLPQALDQLWKNDYALETRPLLDARATSQERVIRSTALNDFVISRGIVSRLIELDVRVDGEILTSYRCDGLIVSSPTGSTAYSLAAGGAVVCPTAEVFTITPICPHTLSNRSVVVSLDSTIQVTVVNRKPETILSADGQNETELTAGDSVTIRRSRHSVHLVRLAGTSFFDTLRRKLQWSGSHIKR